MNPEIKEKWIAALESGEYEQGQQCLNDNNKFCCLGVLSDLYIKETGLAQWKIKGISRKIFATIGQTIDEHYLPKVVAEWAGLPSWYNVADTKHHAVELPVPVDAPEKDNCDTLALANDQGLTFPQIAQIIREQL